ncbi:SRPBCC family protein [Methylobacter sp. YRD-M1]|uniref:SRPBCC family protein n=1 Tax=Methylobacter sp. YRD-M1 TaxID=2911520 RepID=UPI00227CA0A7|nr:SRPBCC family protein [Methylobacter sp. YRD-M1]WAK00687.1 SRPBCC family protein [Methylobacter sp. YRD-M1]
MPEFSLNTNWLIPAPVEAVWSCLIDTENWPSWWKYVISVEEIEPGDASGINNIRRYYWRTCLPYTLMLNLCVTEIETRRFVAVKVDGDLQGHGYCQLCPDSTDNYTEVEFRWQVQTRKPWMNRFATLAAPIFAWNHARVMKSGEESLIRYLSTVKNL